MLYTVFETYDAETYYADLQHVVRELTYARPIISTKSANLRLGTSKKEVKITM